MSFYFFRFKNSNFWAMVADVLKLVFFFYGIFVLYSLYVLIAAYSSIAIDQETFIYYLRTLLFFNFLVYFFNTKIFILFFLFFPLFVSLFFFTVFIFSKYFKFQYDSLKYMRELVIFFGFFYFFIFLLILLQFLSEQELYQSFFNIYDYQSSLRVQELDSTESLKKVYLFDQIKEILNLLKL